MQTPPRRSSVSAFLRAVLVLFSLSLSLSSANILYAQANAGITGTVTDSTGAVVANAKVTITDQGTGVQAHAVTSSAGTYAVTGLVPGEYSITVEASGFKKSVQNGIRVEVTTDSTVNTTLTTGAASETVEVTAEAIALNTTQPQLGSSIEPAVVQALPNEVSGRGRQVDSIQFLVPGTTGSAFSHRIGGGVDFEEEILYNGVPAPQPETEGYTTNFNPPYEMVQEIHVARSTRPTSPSMATTRSPRGEHPDPGCSPSTANSALPSSTTGCGPKAATPLTWAVNSGALTRTTTKSRRRAASSPSATKRLRCPTRATPTLVTMAVPLRVSCSACPTPSTAPTRRSCGCATCSSLPTCRMTSS